ncbi:MAG: NAD-dependent malic enzyme [Kiritimatiellales bacterium]|jgi:malate dehydrogenase (oxaloacetate-decarboxylating)(NADP+)
MTKNDGEIRANGGFNIPTGISLLKDSLRNKGTAFSEEERDALGLRGLLPPRIFPMSQQVDRALMQLRRKESDLEKYIFLTALQQRNETLFFRLLLDHLEETMPIIYTPTVGQACLEYGGIFRSPRGLWISIRDRGNVERILRNWPNQGVKLIVVTDGERILGLGDLGALGMGIPVGKLALYTACAGLHPYYCLPITLDVGTNNTKLLDDPFYIGLSQARVRGEEYQDFLNEFIVASQKVFPGSLIQFEDFGNHNAFEQLGKWRDRICCFNDDIQGTAAVALAGMIAASRVTGTPLRGQKLLFFGAGEAGTGIGELFVSALREEGVPEKEARLQCWFVDSKGLLVKDRGDEMPKHKLPFAHEAAPCTSFAEAVERIRPTALIGVAGTGRAFTPEILGAMAAINERPIIFALSNPTSKAECTAEEAYGHTSGRAIFASGSPFPPVELGGQTFHPGQGNNVYIFPGVGLGVLATAATRVTEPMFLATARTLAGEVSAEDLARGSVYPPLGKIREVSRKIAVAVAEEAHASGLARVEKPNNIEMDISNKMFVPDYGLE